MKPGTALLPLQLPQLPDISFCSSFLSPEVAFVQASILRIQNC
jgi:hypothetical protein